MPVNWDTGLFGPVHEEFGEPFDYQPKGGTPFVMPDAIFEDAYLGQTIMDGEVKAIQMAPVAVVRLASYPAGTAPLKGDVLMRQSTGIGYIVSTPEPDLNGTARLKLQRAPS